MNTRFCRAAGLRAHVGGRNRIASAVTLAAMLVAGHSTTGFAAGNAENGANVYQDCMICHSLDKNEIAPKHRDVFGRKAGSVPDYDYSAALKASNIVWDETALDRWLTDPQALVPGTKMTFSVDDAQDRADVIAFLKEKARTNPASAMVGAR